MCVLFSFLKAWPLGWADTRLLLTGLFMKVESEDRWLFYWIAFNEITFHPRTETPHDKHVHTKQTQSAANGLPREHYSAHSVYYPPQLLISVFPVLWEATLCEQEDRPVHKNWNRTPSKPAGTLLTPQPPSKTGHLLFLAPSHSVAHCYCVLSLPLICLIYSHIPLPFHYPLPSSLTSSNFSGPRNIIRGDCRPCSA